MSTEVTNFIDISLDTTEVTKDNAITVTSSSPYEVTPQNVDTVVEGYKKEYSIVGDGIYASVSADEAPSWLLGLIDAVVAASVANGMVDYDLLVQDVYNAIDSIDVAKNTFVTQVDITPLVDGIVASHLQTLNATIGNTYATKVELSTALATSEAALAQDITDLSVSFNDELDSRITSVQTAYASADSALANDITALETAFEDQEGNLSATATAVSSLQTYVGLDDSNNPDGTGLLVSVSNLQKATDGLLEVFTGSHFVVTDATDGDIDTNELITNQWPYALWVPMEGTVDPTATTRIAYKDAVSSSYAIPEFTLYKNTTANTFWEYLPTTGTGWEEILETEYNSRTTTVRDAHLGDTFIRYTVDNEYAESYKFILTDVDTTSPFNTDSDGYCWALVVDTAANAAYAKALEALDLADNKRRVFVAKPVAPYDIGDLWSVGNDYIPPGFVEGDLLRASTASSTVYGDSHWIAATRYTDDTTVTSILTGALQLDLSDHNNSAGWQTASEVTNTASSTLGTWITDTYNPDLVSLGVTIDSKVESYFAATEPYAASIGTQAQDGDLWYDTDNKLLYRFVYSATTPSWERIEDQDALDAAAAAQTIAEGKITTFVQSTAPIAEGEGDIWVDSDDNNHMYYYNAIIDSNTPYNVVNWVSIRDTANDNILSTAVSDIAGLQETNDGVVNSYYQTGAPTGASYGDWWVDTDSSPLKAYRYEDVDGKNVGTLAWRDNSSHILGKAYIGMVNAQSTADGKIKSFYQAGIPTAEGIGDIWVDTDDNNKTYRAAITGANEIKVGEWEAITDTSALGAFLTAQSSEILLLQAQADGVGVTYFQTSEPYTATSSTADNHGDIWYDTDASSSTAYRLVWSGSAGTWTPITDSNTLSALDAAAATKAAADGTINTYASATEPATAVEGDIWFDTGNSIIYVHNGGIAPNQWDNAGTYLASSADINIEDITVGTQSFAEYLAQQVDDNSIVVLSGSDHKTATTARAGDIYIETTTATTTNGTSVAVTETWKAIADNPAGTTETDGWVLISNNEGLTALQDLADGKRTVFAGTSVPTTAVERDLWIPEIDIIGTGTVVAPQYTQGEIYQYDGTIWVAATRYTEDLDAFVSTVDGYVAALTGQIDQKIEYYFQASTDTSPYDTTGFPVGSFPVADRSARDGDVLYFTDTKNSYYYSSTTNTWSIIQDQDALDAIADAAEAQGAADGKVSQFYAWGGTSAPASYTVDGFTIEADNFKYWYKTDGKLYYKPNTAWVLVPTFSDISGSTYIAEGDLLVVFDPTNRDMTNYSYNGTSWQINGPNGIISKSKFFVDLENEVIGPTGHVATSLAELEVSSSAYADALAESVESKFAYNSNIAIDGLYYSSGFGLNAVGSSGSGTELDPFDSEFWVNAERFVLKSPTYPGIEASFQVTPSGIKLDSDMIVDGSITTNKLSVVDFSGNLVGNGSFAYDDARGWEPLPATMFTTTLADRKCLAMATTAADSVLRATPDTPITPGDELSIRFFGAASSGGSATIRVNVVFYRIDGSYLSGYWSFGQTFNNTTWTEYSSGTTQIVAPAEAAFVRFVIRRVAGGTGTGYITGISAIYRRSGSTIITPNSITSDSLAVNSVTADALAANSVTTDSLTASSITADKLNVTDLSAISANLGTIQAGTANIADLAVETLKIANHAVSNTGADEDTIAIGTGFDYYTVASVVLNTDGGNVTIVQTGGIVTLGSGGETGATILDMRILENGVVVWEYPGIVGNFPTNVLPSTVDLGTSLASTTSYTTQIRRNPVSGAGTVSFTGKIVVTELKK